MGIRRGKPTYSRGGGNPSTVGGVQVASRGVRLHSKRRQLASITAIAATAIGLAIGGLALAGTTTVQLTASGPQPATVTVGVGDTVSWVGADSQNHSIVAASFTSPVIRPGDTYSHVMDTPGKFPYTATSFGPSKKGLIVVTVNGTVSLAVDHPSVVYGSSVVLSGSSPLPGKPVTLSMSPGGRHHGGGNKAWTNIATVQTSSAGTFSTVVEPQTNSSYRVTVVPKLSSQPVAVQVRPRLTVSAWPLRLAAGKVLRVVARITPAKAASSLELKQIVGKKRPKTVGQKTVGSNGTAVFAWRVVPGRSLLRVDMPKGKGAAFVSITSRTLSVTGTGTGPAKTSAAKPKKKG